MSQKNDFGVLYVVQAPSRPNRSRKDDIQDELRELSKEELIEIRKDIIKLINDTERRNPWERKDTNW